MKAVVYHEYGSPDELSLEEVEKPTPSDDQVLVKVHAASVNSWDWDLLRGMPYLTRLGGLRTPPHPILGADIAGRVEAVGGSVTQFQPGDEVFGDISGCGWGGFAEYVAVPEDALALKPANATFEEAAAVPQAASLALQGLRIKGRIQPGQKVLINGAGGGVGTFAVQLARLRKAEVTGVDSAPKLDMVRSLGADHVIDYTQADFAKDGQRYDLIVDVAGHRSVFDLKRTLNPGGAYAMLGGSTARIFQTMLVGPMIAMPGSNKLRVVLYKTNTRDLGIMTRLMEAGRVVPVIDSRYPLTDVAEALRYFGEGRVKGKIVITV